MRSARAVGSCPADEGVGVIDPGTGDRRGAVTIIGQEPLFALPRIDHPTGSGWSEAEVDVWPMSGKTWAVDGACLVKRSDLLCPASFISVEHTMHSVPPPNPGLLQVA